MANNKIKDNQSIEIYEISKKDAEVRWGDEIYDLFPFPKSLLF